MVVMKLKAQVGVAWNARVVLEQQSDDEKSNGLKLQYLPGGRKSLLIYCCRLTVRGAMSTCLRPKLGRVNLESGKNVRGQSYLTLANGASPPELSPLEYPLTRGSRQQAA